MFVTDTTGRKQIKLVRDPDAKGIHIDLELEANESFVLRLPDGEVLIVHHFDAVGYGAHFYDDPEDNPRVSIMGNSK